MDHVLTFRKIGRKEREVLAKGSLEDLKRPPRKKGVKLQVGTVREDPRRCPTEKAVK